MSSLPPRPFSSDQISPLDDLAFDMYQDPEVAAIVRRLDRQKQRAVLGQSKAVVRYC